MWIFSINIKQQDQSFIMEQAFDSLQHRGPDSSKVKLFNNNSLNIKFGFHRLAIVDHKNKNSNQPFVTEKSVLVFNGEIYNYLSLKRNLLKKK